MCWTRLVLDLFLGEIVFFPLLSRASYSSLDKSPNELLYVPSPELDLGRISGIACPDSASCPRNPKSLGGGERDRLGLWTSTGGEVENCTGVGWLWLWSSSPEGVSHEELPADVEVDRSLPALASRGLNSGSSNSVSLSQLVSLWDKSVHFRLQSLKIST